MRAVAFDKTGTLTLDVPLLRDPAELERLSAEDRGALELMVSSSLHPVGKSLREALLLSNLAAVRPEMPYTLEEITGSGVRLNRGETTWCLGRPEWTGSAETSAECSFSRNEKPLAVFRFAETLRPDAMEQVNLLQQRGYTVLLLSGDRRAKVETLARQLSLAPEQILSEATPEEKAATLRRLGLETLMIGDGANDALAFRESLCTATPAIDRGLLENRADFYFTGTSLQGLCGVLDLALQYRTAVRRAMVFTILYNIAIVAAALSGWIVPVVAAVVMPASSAVSLLLVAWSFRTRLSPALPHHIATG